MFLRIATAKKLFKEAFGSSRLAVRRYAGYLYISGSAWEMEMVFDTAPYKIKAAIVELCGRLPEEDEGFVAAKEGIQDIQERKELINEETLLARYMRAKCVLTETPLVFDHKHCMYKLLQYQENRTFTLINAGLLALLDNREVDMEHGEGIPCGPCSEHASWMSSVYWHNECGTLCLLPSTLQKVQDRNILDVLRVIDFAKEME